MLGIVIHANTRFELKGSTLYMKRHKDLCSNRKTDPKLWMKRRTHFRTLNHDILFLP